jgi:GTP cyclohydrolase I
MDVLNVSLRRGPSGTGQGRAPSQPRGLPDVARSRSGFDLQHPLDRVGMAEIEVPVLLPGPGGALQLTPARAGAFVNLSDPEARAIHMSRLFLALQEGLESGPLEWPLVARLLEQLRASHTGLATEAHLEVAFELMTKRRALSSEHSGWRSYPVRVAGSLTGAGLSLRLGTTVTYSSTCPCSAALARQLIQDAFERDFPRGEVVSWEAARTWLGTSEAIRATPHSQRSEAEVLVEMAAPGEALGFLELVDLVEGALETVVQAAVKRQDEQAFALLNGQNPMFCEDAARRVKRALDGDRRLRDYRIRCEHQESLHPHDAVSMVTRGIPGGFVA